MGHNQRCGCVVLSATIYKQNLVTHNRRLCPTYFHKISVYTINTNKKLKKDKNDQSFGWDQVPKRIYRLKILLIYQLHRDVEIPPLVDEEKKDIHNADATFHGDGVKNKKQ